MSQLESGPNSSGTINHIINRASVLFQILSSAVNLHEHEDSDEQVYSHSGSKVPRFVAVVVKRLSLKRGSEMTGVSRLSAPIVFFVLTFALLLYFSTDPAFFCSTTMVYNYFVWTELWLLLTTSDFRRLSSISFSVTFL
jgi:hypothetical protein